MRYFLKKLIPLLLALCILFSIGWYFLVYDTTLTRDLLLQNARRFEKNGSTTLAVWLYNLAYLQSGNDDAVAIELAEQFKAIGNFSKAEYTLTKAIQDGGGAELYIALCKTYVQQDKLLDAVTMLDRIGNAEIKAQLDAMRPKAPEASFPSGTYDRYLQVEFSCETDRLYVCPAPEYPTVVGDAYTDAFTLPRGETILYAVCVDEHGLVSPLACFDYRVEQVVEQIFFADIYVENAIRQQLQLPAGSAIYTNQLWGVTEFTMPANAKTCQDLKWLPDLETLTIEKAAFTDLSPLVELAALQTLTVTDTPIADSDLSFLAGTPRLRRLTLANCGISTITDMKVLKNLTYLNLEHNAIRNISALSAMTDLEELHIAHNALIHLQDIETLVNLRTLDVSYNYLSTTRHIASMTALTTLNVSSNNFTKLEGIGELKALQHFSTAFNNLTDISSLGNCTLLKTLDISNNSLFNIQALGKLTLLEELDFSHNEVSRLPQFSADCALRIIRGEYNVLSSLDNLAGLQNLTHAYMDYNAKITDVSALSRCRALRELHIYGTKVTDISKLVEANILVYHTPKT